MFNGFQKWMGPEAPTKTIQLEIAFNDLLTS